LEKQAEEYHNMLATQNLNNISEFDKEISIPVIGTAVVNNTNWLKRLIASVDYPVDNFVIINNNGRGQLTDELDILSKTPHRYINKIHVVTMPSNIGVASAWNLIIKSFIHAPYWIIVNDDVAFCDGLLKEFYTAAKQNTDVGIIHAYEGDPGFGSWDLFLIRDFTITQYGLFDENFYPAYSEDIDYLLRLRNHNIQRIMNLTTNYYHGDGLTGEYVTHGSQTTKSENLSDKIQGVRTLNEEYLKEKWGNDWRWNPNTLPFDTAPITHTRYDLEFVRKKYLGF
jgi:GT2 family glycosyltransferase